MKHAFRNVLAILLFTSAPPAFTAELPKEGNYDYTACQTSVNNLISFSKDHTASSYELTGSINSNPPVECSIRIRFAALGPIPL